MWEKTLDFLSNFDYWQLMVGFLLCLLYAVVAKPSIKWKDFQFDFFTRRNGYASFIAWRSQLEKRIYFLEYIGITKTQMKRVDSSLLQVKSKLLTNYSALLKNAVPDKEVTSTRDYMDYGAHVEVMLNIIMRDKVRELILDQDILIPDVTSREFEDFARDTAKYWYDAGKSYMDLWYVSEGRAISREVLRQSVFTLMFEFERETRDILREIKGIETEAHSRIECIKQEIRVREKKIFGTAIT